LVHDACLGFSNLKGYVTRLSKKLQSYQDLVGLLNKIYLLVVAVVLTHVANFWIYMIFGRNF
jgi:hypothetical protein